ncbi:hypothetical protein [Flavisolibacter nicotianae]|uniref:hypothetical protein n=1 Tax=Flavisolibacter nicotianae TaxID=2364882 RepID=UPI0013C44AC7|nr:hypothetical protein [Flavisolibacter nicotianae]
MQYAKIEITDGLELNYQQIGEELEKELEGFGFQIALRTVADWGYVFRTKSDGQAFDVSIVHLDGNSFGIAIEPEEGLFSDIFKYFKKPHTKGIKQWVEEILTTDVGAKSIRWFTADEWITTFGQTFWSYSSK